jgi:hypothetical protein
MNTWRWLIPLLLSFPAHAEWTFVDAGDGVDRYVDLETTWRHGALVRVWEVDDKDRADRAGIMSLLSRTEYDCNERRYRIVELSAHSRHMSEGMVLFSERIEGDWHPIGPGTLGEASLEKVCEL